MKLHNLISFRASSISFIVSIGSAHVYFMTYQIEFYYRSRQNFRAYWVHWASAKYFQFYKRFHRIEKYLTNFGMKQTSSVDNLITVDNFGLGPTSNIFSLSFFSEACNKLFFCNIQVFMLFQISADYQLVLVYMDDNSWDIITT